VNSITCYYYYFWYVTLKHATTWRSSSFQQGNTAACVDVEAVATICNILSNPFGPRLNSKPLAHEESMLTAQSARIICHNHSRDVISIFWELTSTQVAVLPWRYDAKMGTGQAANSCTRFGVIQRV